MFNPTRDQVRQFFFDAWRKHRQGALLTGLDQAAVGIILAHPEYHAVLDDPEHHRDRQYLPEAGVANPFLHMSMHLAIEEQLSIDQPSGLKAEFTRLAAKLGERHATCHQVIECLGEIMWRAQRDGAPPDTEAYLACIKRR